MEAASLTLSGNTSQSLRAMTNNTLWPFVPGWKSCQETFVRRPRAVTVERVYTSTHSEQEMKVKVKWSRFFEECNESLWVRANREKVWKNVSQLHQNWDRRRNRAAGLLISDGNCSTSDKRSIKDSDGSWDNWYDVNSQRELVGAFKTQRINSHV